MMFLNVPVSAIFPRSTLSRLLFGKLRDSVETPFAAFEASGYRPRDEDVYLMYGEPGRMLGRFTLHDNRTLFLFIFAASAFPDTLEAQKALLRDCFGKEREGLGRIMIPQENTGGETGVDFNYGCGVRLFRIASMGSAERLMAAGAKARLSALVS
jgi:hypothetical protein